MSQQTPNHGSSPIDLIDRVLGFVGDRADTQVMVTRTRHGLTRFANSHIHQHVGEETVSVDLRMTRDGRSVAASGTSIDDESLQAQVEKTWTLAALAPVDETFPGLTGDEPQPREAHADPATVAATPDTRAEIVARFVEAGRGLNAAGFCESLVNDTAYGNSAGRRRACAVSRATIDGIHRTDTSSGCGHATSRSIADLDGAASGARAADLARRAQDPGDLEPGRYPVVLGPDPVSTIAIFNGLYAFNARAVQEERSAVTLDEEMFDPAVTLVDDVTDPRSLALPFDVEGTDRGRLTLIDAGRVAAVTHNRRTAAKAGTSSTGHHVPGSDVFGPLGDSLRLLPGTNDPEDLVAGVERGIYIVAFNYCRVLDPKTLVVTGLTRNGTFLIEDGRITRPLGNLRFTQSFTEALAPGNVVAVGNDDRFADCEFGPGLVIAPSMHLASWNITGGQQG